MAYADFGLFWAFPPIYPNTPILAFPGNWCFWHSGISWHSGIWHFLESGILTFPGWCYISSEYMIYRKCIYTVYLYCLKSLHICYIILFYFIVFYYPEISHILHYSVILLCLCCLLVGSAVFSFLFIIVFTCRVVITDGFWLMVEWYCLLQVPSGPLLWLEWDDRSCLQVPFCGVSPSWWGTGGLDWWPACLVWGMASGDCWSAAGLPAWGVEVWWVLVAILVVRVW